MGPPQVAASYLRKFATMVVRLFLLRVAGTTVIGPQINLKRLFQISADSEDRPAGRLELGAFEPEPLEWHNP